MLYQDEPRTPAASWQTCVSYGCLALALAYAAALATANTPELWRSRRGHFLWDTGLVECGLWPVILSTWLGLFWGIKGLLARVRYRWLAILPVVLNAALCVWLFGGL
jgi:hypothetical protein